LQHYSAGELRVTCLDKETPVLSEMRLDGEGGEGGEGAGGAGGAGGASPMRTPSPRLAPRASVGGTSLLPFARQNILDAREALVRSLHLAIGEGVTSHRLFVKSVRPTSVPYSTVDGRGRVDEPATCLVVGVRKLEGEVHKAGSGAAAALAALSDLYKGGELGNALGVPQVST